MNMPIRPTAMGFTTEEPLRQQPTDSFL